MNENTNVNPSEKKARLLLIDGHAMLYRAFFAFPLTLTSVEGKPINAVYGFARILLTVMRDLKPKYILVSFDVGKSFRHEEYPFYKAHREKMPDELKEQEPLAFTLVQTLNMPLLMKDGFEADDILGSVSRIAMKSEEEVETVIVTGDMDLLQLVVNGKVLVYMPGRASVPAKIYDEEGVYERYGLTPHQITDYKGLAGDSSDNIPGIKGIGQKTALHLLKAFGTIEGIYAYLDKHESSPESEKEAVLKPAVLKKLIEGKESAMESKRLATIITDVTLPFGLEQCLVTGYDKTKVVKLFEELEFKSLMNLLPNDEFEEAIQEALF